ncbi:MAG: polysaccharide deacetylase family protein [Porticoccaceae bacterium]
MTGATIKEQFLRTAKQSGLFALARHLTARQPRILAYHGIWLGEGQFGNFLYMSAEKFAARMALLERWKYPVVALSELAHANNHLPSCPTVITIDDGWHGTWSAMLPALEKYNYPATVYLTTFYCLHQNPVIDVALQYCFHSIDASRIRVLHLRQYQFGPLPIDTDAARTSALAEALKTVAALPDDPSRQAFLQALCREAGINHDSLMAHRWFHLMSPHEVQDAARRGITFECHTHRHRIRQGSRDCLEEEITKNREHIARLTGRAPEHFCYPSGQYSRELWPVLEKCRMTSATTTDAGLVKDNSPKYALPRILDGQDISDLEFEAEMSGFMEIARIPRRFLSGAPGPQHVAER